MIYSSAFVLRRKPTLLERVGGIAEFEETKSFGCVQELIVVIGLTVATFVSTSVDNLFLLVGFLTSPGFRLRGIVVGYAAAVILVLCVGLAVSYAADFAPHRFVGYLGVVPIAMGATRLYKAVRYRGGWEVGTQPTALGAVSVGLVMLANSGDTVAAFLPLFAETRDPFTFVIVAVGAALSLAWCGLARWIIGHAPVQHFLERWASYVLPALLILVGLYILADTRTDTLEPTPGTDVHVVDLRLPALRELGCVAEGSIARLRAGAVTATDLGG